MNILCIRNILHPQQELDVCCKSYDLLMAIRDLDLNQPVSMTGDEDEETLAAIDEGFADADAGRLVPIEEVRKRLERWIA